MAKLHKNKHGKWTECHADKRACRYGGADAHRSSIPETSTSEPTPVKDVKPTGVVETQEPETAEGDGETGNVERGTVLPEVNDDGSVTYVFNPDRLEMFEKNIAKANRRLERADVEERFEYDKEEIYVYDEETGLSYLKIKATLNRPVIRNNGWSFVGVLDGFVNDKGEQIITANGLNGEQLEGNFETEDAVKCDHCGKHRRRNKTYVVRNEYGDYKQVGSNCLGAFLGVRPAGLWAIEDDVVDERVYRNTWGGTNQRWAMIPVKTIVKLGLAVSDGGKKYVGSSSNVDALQTKMRVINYLFGHGTREVIEPDKYENQAETMIKETVFDTSYDYGSNMAKLLREEHVPYSKIGYVVSVIPAYHKQQAVKKRVTREKAKGFIGEPGEVVTSIPSVTVEKVIEINTNYSYWGETANLFIMRTADNKVIKWVTASRNEKVGQIENGSVINIDKLTVKRTGEAYGEDQTEVKNLKFDFQQPFPEK